MMGDKIGHKSQRETDELELGIGKHLSLQAPNPGCGEVTLLRGSLGFVSVVLDVKFGGFRRVMRGVMQMALRAVSMMRGGFVIAVLVVAGGFAMVSRGVLVVLGGFVMMLCGVLRHGCSPVRLRGGDSNRRSYAGDVNVALRAGESCDETWEFDFFDLRARGLSGCCNMRLTSCE
jgi:hypothetical protein